MCGGISCRSAFNQLTHRLSTARQSITNLRLD